MFRIVLVCCVLVGLVSCGGTSVENERLRFDLPDTSGQKITSDDARFEGRVLLVDLWGTWCPPCLEMQPHLRHWHQQYADQGLDIVAINFEALVIDDDRYRESMAKYVVNKDIPYTVLLGGDSRYATDALPGIRNFEGFPTTLFVGRDGVVRHIKSGFFPSEVEWYEDTIKALLAEPAN